MDTNFTSVTITTILGCLSSEKKKGETGFFIFWGIVFLGDGYDE